MIAFVWAQDANGTIGKDGKLPWHLHDDLQYFKQRTLNQIVVMGRKTFAGMGGRPLPKRTNVVLTRNVAYTASGATVLHSREEVLAFAAQHPERKLMIIGGSQVFKLFMDDVDSLYVTRIAGEFAGDTTMPAVPWAEFVLTDSKHVQTVDPQLAHDFETWQRL